ncbi:MAG: hypothetical protein K2X47_01995 [Bdellovibrionales bacterium]|nr:hypothetical protein [Bdellovibrionales bacterium]
MEKKEPEKPSKPKYNLLAPIFRLASLFEEPVTIPKLAEQSADLKTPLQEVHKNYLEYRSKTEAVGTTSRIELDKTILTISMQAMAFTFAIVSGLHPHHHWQIQVAWLLWTAAIFVTLVSMQIAEYAAEKYRSILDDAYDIAKAENLTKLPVAKALEKRSTFIRWFITSNHSLMNVLNYGGPILFMTAVIFAVCWMFLIKGL